MHARSKVQCAFVSKMKVTLSVSLLACVAHTLDQSVAIFRALFNHIMASVPTCTATVCCII